MRCSMWLQMIPGPLCCLQGTGVLVVCCPSMLLGQDLSFVCLCTPLLPSVALDEPLQDFISHPVWSSTTAAWSWLSYCCLTFSLPAAFKPPGWDVSGTCGFPQVAKSLLESPSGSKYCVHMHGNLLFSLWSQTKTSAAIVYFQIHWKWKYLRFVLSDKIRKTPICLGPKVSWGEAEGHSNYLVVFLFLKVQATFSRKTTRAEHEERQVLHLEDEVLDVNFSQHFPFFFF